MSRILPLDDMVEPFARMDDAMAGRIIKAVVSRRLDNLAVAEFAYATSLSQTAERCAESAERRKRYNAAYHEKKKAQAAEQTTTQADADGANYAGFVDARTFAPAPLPPRPRALPAPSAPPVEPPPPAPVAEPEPQDMDGFADYRALFPVDRRNGEKKARMMWRNLPLAAHKFAMQSARFNAEQARASMQSKGEHFRADIAKFTESNMAGWMRLYEREREEAARNSAKTEERNA